MVRVRGEGAAEATYSLVRKTIRPSRVGREREKLVAVKAI